MFQLLSVLKAMNLNKLNRCLNFFIRCTKNCTAKVLIHMFWPSYNPLAKIVGPFYILIDQTSLLCTQLIFSIY